MWVDENGVTHSAWVPAEAILGEESVAALRAVPRAEADAALDDLHKVAMSIFDEAVAGAMPGPKDLDGVDLDEFEYPPEFPGLAPKQGETLSQIILQYLAGVPAQWRYEAKEAVCDVLEPLTDEELQEPADEEE